MEGSMKSRMLTLDMRRHFIKAKEKGEDGKTHIDKEKSGPLADKVAAEYRGGLQIEISFYGVEVRTRETLEMIEERLGYQPMRGGPVEEVGGDEWTKYFCFTKEMQAELKAAGRKDYLKFLLEKRDREEVIRLAMYAVSGVYRMFRAMKDAGKTHGLSIGHSPDMLMLVAWALCGFEDDLNFDHGHSNLPEGEGYRIAWHAESGILELLTHLSF
jgi:hypothetical protein